MKKLNKKNIQSIIIIGLFVVMAGLITFGVIYTVRHYHDGEVLNSGDLPVKFTGDAASVDSIELPNPNLKITLDTLPDTDGTLTEINFKTMTKLFQTSKTSILVLEKTGCTYCEDFEPNFISALENYKLTAYKINISNFTTDELSELYNYLDFNGTPTTYIIRNGVAVHSYAGDADTDTISAFIDYFYIRCN
jgi:thiol-disulfide isomerase/thioredoxin